MSTLLSKHLPEPGLDELRNRSHIIIRERGVSRCTLKAHLYAHWRQVVAARKIIDIRAQSSPVSFRLCAVISLGYDLVDAARAVHDLFHLRLCLQIIGRWIELAPKSVRGAIQIVHSVFEIVFCFLPLVPPRLCVC